MIDLNPLRIYFNGIGKTIEIDKYYFNVIIQQDEEESFSVNVKVRQQDTKEEHLIQFRVGIGKHKEDETAVHDADKPHFELDYFKRDERSFSATLYFTFNSPTDEELMEYAEGTVVVITKMLEHFFEKRSLDLKKLSEIVSEKLVFEELSSSEPVLIGALYECYKNSELVVRQKGQEPLIIKTPHNLKKFLGFEDLLPIYLPLLEKIKKK
ncbi:MAG: hypothetical protein ABIB43_03995 [archaeon]